MSRLLTRSAPHDRLPIPNCGLDQTLNVKSVWIETPEGHSYVCYDKAAGGMEERASPLSLPLDHLATEVLPSPAKVNERCRTQPFISIGPTQLSVPFRRE